MNTLQKLKDKLFSNNKDEFGGFHVIDVKEYSGLTIIGTEKELNQLSLKTQALAHNIFKRKSDGSLALKKMRELPTEVARWDVAYWDEEGFARMPQKDGKRRKNDPYAIWG